MKMNAKKGNFPKRGENALPGPQFLAPPFGKKNNYSQI
jgi:hypothetical protein